MSDIQTSIFQDTTDIKADIAKLNFYLVTNHKNLFYMLAAGLIMPPKGFGKKYYQDTLQNFDGWIPLFINKIPLSATQLSTSETKNLIPCILKINTNELQGSVKTSSPTGILNDRQFPDEVKSTDSIVYLPAPLPVSLIDSIIFNSKSDKTKCEDDAIDFINIPLKHYNLKVDSKLFKSRDRNSWPPIKTKLPVYNCMLDIPIAAGAIMGMLQYIANRSEFGINISKLAFEPRYQSSDEHAHLYSAISHWFSTGKTLESQDVIIKVFWGLLDHLAFHRLSEDHENITNYVLDYLSNLKQKLDKNASERLERLINDLATHSGFSDKTLTELLEQHKKPIPRALILLLTKDSIQELINFQHSSINEVDILYATMLFSAHNGWLGIPAALRGLPYTEKAITHRMAVLSHTLSGSDINFGTMPERPKSVRELFQTSEEKLDKKQLKAALFLSKQLKWDCVQTRITLPRGLTIFDIDGNKTSLILKGEPKAVTTEIDIKSFLDYLSRNPIFETEIQNKIHHVLES